MKDPYRWMYDAHQPKQAKVEPAAPPSDPGDPANPWSKSGWNVTLQFQQMADDLERAKQLCLQAGCKWTDPYQPRR